ncbi:transposase [Bradyrhizobium sp. URHC0002]
MPLDPSGAIPVQAFYGIRSERQLMKQLDNHLYCRSVRLSPDDPVWDPTSFTKNRERLQNGNMFTKLMNENHPQIEACASQKNLRLKDGSDDGDGANFHGQKRKNDTHASTSDPDVAFAKRAGRDAKLSHTGHATIENRHGPPCSLSPTAPPSVVPRKGC